MGHDPDAQWFFLHDSCTWVNHAAFVGAGIFLDLAFPLENPRRTDVALVDSSVSGSISLDRGSYDGDYLHLCVCKQGKLRTERTQFTQSGSFNPSFAEGLGGVRVFGGDIGPLDPPALDFDGIEWVGNAGSIGPALSIQYGQCDLNVRNSLFRENKAYKLVSVLVFSIFVGIAASLSEQRCR